MNKFLKYSVSLLCILFYSLHAQEQTVQFKKSLDSLETILKTAPQDTTRVKLLLRIANRNKNIDPDKIMRYSKEALALSQKLKFVSGIFRSFEVMSHGIRAVGLQKEFLTDLDRWEKISDSIGDQRQKARSYNLRASMLMDLGNYSRSVEYYFKALTIDEKLNDKHSIASDYGNLALVYESMKKYPLALDYVNKAMLIDKEIGDMKGYMNGMGNLSNIYSYMGDNKKALAYAFDFLKMAEAEHNKTLIAGGLCNVGSLYDEIGESDKALEYYQKALAMGEEIDNDELFIATGINVGNLYYDKGQFDKSISILNPVVKKVEASDLKFAMGECYHILAADYKGKKDFAMAYEYLEKYYAVKDTLLNAENSRQVNEMSARYEKDKQELKISALEKEKTLSSQVIEKQNNFKNVLIIVVVLIIVLAIVLFRAFMNKQKANKLLESSNAEIQHQKDIIEEKNKSITDSIYYAKRIQTTLLPSEKYISKSMEKLNKKE